MTLDRDRPEILQPPQHPQACCTQQTITVSPDVLAKTAQKHDYPSTAHRRSYARRTGAERGFATAKDPATNDISRGWCRLMGLTPLMLHTTTLLIVRNQRILQAWNARQEENQRRAAKGLPPKTRRRRRKTLASTRRRAALSTAAHDPPPNHGTPRTRDSSPGPDHRQRQHAQEPGTHCTGTPPRQTRTAHDTTATVATPRTRSRMSHRNVKLGLTET